MSIDIIAPDPVLWDDPASLPERALRAFERHKDWIPTQEVWSIRKPEALYCCALAAICQDSAPATAWPDSFIGRDNRVAFTLGFDSPHRPSLRNHPYYEAGIRAWELAKPLAAERRRELNA